MNEAAANDNPQALQKQVTALCVCKNGQIICRPGTADPLPKIVLPMNINGDSRLFLKNGELVHPSVTIEFRFQQVAFVSGIEMQMYEEVSTTEFDPSDMQPVAIRSLEQAFNELNASLK